MSRLIATAVIILLSFVQQLHSEQISDADSDYILSRGKIINTKGDDALTIYHITHDKKFYLCIIDDRHPDWDNPRVKVWCYDQH